MEKGRPGTSTTLSGQALYHPWWSRYRHQYRLCSLHQQSHKGIPLKHKDSWTIWNRKYRELITPCFYQVSNSRIHWGWLYIKNKYRENRGTLHRRQVSKESPYNYFLLIISIITKQCGLLKKKQQQHLNFSHLFIDFPCGHVCRTLIIFDQSSLDIKKKKKTIYCRNINYYWCVIQFIECTIQLPYILTCYLLDLFLRKVY